MAEFATSDPAEALTMVPDRVVYAQHYGSEDAYWGDDKLQVDGKTHPVVYVSAGSHASQFSEGLFLGNSASTGFGCDTTIGPHDTVRPTVRTISSDPEQALAAYPWIAYKGHWGEVQPRRIYTGPTGPNMKVFWEKPFTWSERARDRSFAVPGAGAARSSATEFFCSTAGTGSTLLLRYTSNPVPTLLILGSGLVAVVWWIRRSPWRSASVPVFLTRSAGETFGASVAWIRGHPGVFVGASMATVLPGLAYTVVSTLDAMARPVSSWLR